VSIIYSLLSYDKHGKFNKMPPKVATLLLAATISGWGDTSIAKSSDADL